MTWIIRQTSFRQNVEIENSPNFNDVKVSRYTVDYKCTIQSTIANLLHRHLVKISRDLTGVVSKYSMHAKILFIIIYLNITF